MHSTMKKDMEMQPNYKGMELRIQRSLWSSESQAEQEVSK